ncbi:MAG TPA: hypothetical protein VIC62_00610 [Nakamurella sp.]|jgi:hypothetical protein
MSETTSGSRAVPPQQVVPEGGHVGDVLLEQVTDAGGAVVEQFHRVSALHVLGQHDHRGSW